jgi:succinyl-diaminopimelate desuccinylase
MLKNVSIDPVTLTQELVRIPSLTHDQDQVRLAIELCEKTLREIGFDTRMMPFESADGVTVHNVYARFHGGEPVDDDPSDFLFCGHVDVVPPGDTDSWHHPPYSGQVDKKNMYGRGMADMKSAVASSMVAPARFIADTDGHFPGTIHILIVGDEEDGIVHGAERGMEILAEEGIDFDAAIVGEASGFHQVADHIKYGARGVFVGKVESSGTQGHAAYTDVRANPVHGINVLGQRLMEHPMDDGNDHLQPTGIQITNIDVGNDTHNIVPGRAEATLDIRFIADHSMAYVAQFIQTHCEAVSDELDGVNLKLMDYHGGEAFLSHDPDYLTLLADSIETVVGYRPEMTTIGGSSDARFIAPYCPVVHIGHLNHTIHQVDEHILIDDIERLTAIYTDILHRFYQA